MSKTFPLPITAGGRLITDFSSDNIGPANYVQKDNWRREDDQEVRREGWVKFEPVEVGATQYVFDGSETLRRLGELVRPNGDRVALGASLTKIKKFNTTTGAWDTIGSSYSASGKRWQIVTINGYAIFNNTIDLPVSYRVEDAAVTPLYELREVGVASVGRIDEYNGFLMIADITDIKADQLDHWMNGYSTYAVGSTNAKSANFTILTAEDTDEYDVTTGASTITATLPASPNDGDYFWVEKVDAGAGSVVTSPVIEDITVTLDDQFDRALIWWDSVQEKWVAVVFPLGVIPADAPYGIPPSYITNRIPWDVSNSEYGEPTNWAPAFSVVMAAASTSIVLPFASQIFEADVTRVAVINGGADGGTLGGQEDTPTGVLVTGVSGATLTLAETTDTSITYPRTVTVMRFADVSTLSRRYHLQGDNSAISTTAKLGNLWVIFRRTSIYVARYTGNTDALFVFTPRYAGSNVPVWPDAVANIRGDYLLYPARGNRMFMFDGVSWPVVHATTDACRSLFFASLDDTSDVFAVENPATKEWWWCRPDYTLAYDYDTGKEGTVSKITAVINAAAAVQRPDGVDEWFILGIANQVFTYGLVTGVDPITTWQRDGVSVNAVLKFGLNFFGDPSNEKTVLEYTPILASASPDVSLTYQLASTYNPSATPTALLSPVETLPTPAGENFVTLYFMAIYFQETLTLTETDDVDARLSMRIYEVDLVKGAGVTRRAD